VENNYKHDLFWELEAFDPKWQMHYRTLALAARAAGVLNLYGDWLKSPDGVRYSVQMAGVPDTVQMIEDAKRIREKELTLAGLYARLVS